MDSNDKARFSEAHDYLTMCILEQDNFRGIPLIVLANKQDLPGAASCKDIAEALGLYEIKNRYMYVLCGLVFVLKIIPMDLASTSIFHHTYLRTLCGLQNSIFNTYSR